MKNQNKTHFYSHLISLDDIELEMDSLDISKEEKDELSQLAHTHLHYTILDIVLSNLSEDDKKTFAHHANTIHPQHTWRFLKTRIDNLEEKILNAAESLKKELLADINETKTI